MSSTPGGSLKRATVLMSGGIDSAACVRFLKKQSFDVEGIFVDYGQAARVREAEACTAVATYFGIEVHSFSVGGSAPSGAGEIVGRNSLLIGVALFATGGRTGLVSLGIHAGTPYYDCSRSFIHATARLVAEQTDGRVALYTPFADWSKADVYEFFLAERLPLGLTYSCEAGGSGPCGRCASCLDRLMLT